jgi:heterodisulfide reductase subunit B
MIHDIVEAAYDHAVDMMVPSPRGQSSFESYQDEIIQKFGGNFKKPVVYYCQLIICGLWPIS